MVGNFDGEWVFSSSIKIVNYSLGNTSTKISMRYEILDVHFPSTLVLSQSRDVPMYFPNLEMLLHLFLFLMKG